ncbi:MAG: carbohydrate kinase [Anaerolineae bacterium]|nr:carbohydrate kinase [Anaerolineae bacterium]
MFKPFLLGIDQGTSGSKAVIIDESGQVRGFSSRPLARLYPRPDWVEQEPQVVVAGVQAAIADALTQAGCHPEEIAACGIASQRNTEFVWDSRNGRALGNAITWQDLRSQPLLAEIQAQPWANELRPRLGYAPGPYMSALHLAWRLRHDTAVREAAQSGHLRVGLSASWLIQAMGQPAGHLIDRSLAQATGLFDFRQHDYWDEWLDWIGLDRCSLPQAVPTLHDYGTLTLHGTAGRTATVPVLAMIGDQQAALFGHGCRQPGQAECTHGTSSYLKVFVGTEPPDVAGVNNYYAWELHGRQHYYLEAPTTVNGAALRWLRDNLRLFANYSELDTLAGQVTDSGGLLFVPAFTGLNAPFDDAQTRGTVLGLTLGHQKAHIARAFLESIGCQMRLILAEIEQNTAVSVPELRVGGGVSASNVACQIQADITGIPVLRPTFTETTAWAAALLAGLGAGVWADETAVPLPATTHTRFEPQTEDTAVQTLYHRWQKATQLMLAFAHEARP